MCECFVREICQLYANNECTGDCSMRSYYDRILKQSQLPRKLQRVDKIRLIPDDVDLEAFRKLARIRDDIVNFVEQGKENKQPTDYITIDGTTYTTVNINSKPFRYYKLVDLMLKRMALQNQ